MRKYISIIIIVAFVCTSIKTPVYAQMAQDNTQRLPVPGVMVHLSSAFTPAHLQGITIHPDNALKFDFLIHRGDQVMSEDQKKAAYKKLIKYFLASLTIPDQDQWVNLSPYEKDRIIKEDFGKTEMGRDLLAQDYMLKQITSSLIYPEDGLGKRFWDKVYARAWSEYHTAEIPVNTFNKVWIVPDQAIVYESGNSAYILKSHLKVMLEEDYLALKKNNKSVGALGSQLIREIILPELEKEVNEGKNFANLRQMYSGMILATWYKKALKESLLGKIYADKAKIKGFDQDPQANEEIYRRYLMAFKKGVFNYIKEDVNKYTHEVIPRKYFSGGFLKATGHGDLALVVLKSGASISKDDFFQAALDGQQIDQATILLQTGEGPDAAMSSIPPVGRVNRIHFTSSGQEFNVSPGTRTITFDFNNEFAKASEDTRKERLKNALEGEYDNYDQIILRRTLAGDDPLAVGRPTVRTIAVLKGKKTLDALVEDLANRIHNMRVDEAMTTKSVRNLLMISMLALSALSNAQKVRLKAVKTATAAGIYELRALDGDRQALDTIIERSQEELPFAGVLKELAEYRLPEAVTAEENNNFSYYFQKAQEGDLKALDFLESIRENPLVKRGLMDMDIHVLENRSQINPPIGQEKDWAINRELNAQALIFLAKYGKNGGAVFAARQLDPTGLALETKKDLAWFGNFSAIGDLAGEYVRHNLDNEDKPFDKEALKGPMNDEKISEINRAISLRVTDDQDGKFLRENDFPGLIDLVLKGNPGADELLGKLITEVGNRKVAQGWKETDIKALEAGLGKGDYQAFQVLEELYLFGNLQAVNAMTSMDISGFKSAAETGNVYAIYALLDLKDFHHPQAGGILKELKTDELSRPFKAAKNAQTNEAYEGTLQAVRLLVVLARCGNDDAAHAVRTLDFSKASGMDPSDVRLSFFMEIADMGNALMRDYLIHEVDAAKAFRQINGSSGYYMPKSFYLLVMLDNQSAKAKLSELDESALEQSVESGVPGSLALLKEKLTLERESQKDLEAQAGKWAEGQVKKQLERQENIRKSIEDHQADKAMKGGIDFNPANFNMQIKRDGQGVPLPLALQDMDQLMQIQGFVPEIIEIKPAVNVPIMNELQQKLKL